MVQVPADYGYIGVGEDETVQLFYFFVESEGNPEEDPLIIWLAGGPGCSNLHAFFFEIGPLKIQNGKYIDDVPALQADPNSWTKLASIIYLDGPALTGYSYTTTVEAAHSSDTLSASQTTEFIRKVTNKGYLVGNPLTNKRSDFNSRFEFAYTMALISKELFEKTRKDCNGEYAEVDKNYLGVLGVNEVNKANYYYASLWANNKKVMKVLDVRKLIKRNCRALIFSGDHDMRVPHIGTHDWIKSLNLTITDSNWDAWEESHGSKYKPKHIESGLLINPFETNSSIHASNHLEGLFTIRMSQVSYE
ncbi:peptidase S10, serine carboxypeptidase, alpha/beta hydrolase fold protein [Tanacetum coccineum]